jgi:hypothetical protein
MDFKKDRDRSFDFIRIIFMAVLINIPTDKRTKELLSVLLQDPQISLSNQIDSVNYGEGYELKYKNLSFRLYDDERSDQVAIDIDFKEGLLNWDKTFEKIIKQNPGKGVLKIEIDRHNKTSKEMQMEALRVIEEILKKENFSIAIELV